MTKGVKRSGKDKASAFMFIDHLIALASFQQLRDIKEAIKRHNARVKKLKNVMAMCGLVFHA